MAVIFIDDDYTQNFKYKFLNKFLHAPIVYCFSVTIFKDLEII